MLIKAFEPNHFRQEAHQLVDILADYLQEVENQTEKTVIPYQSPEEALAYWQADFEVGQSDVGAFFKDVIARSTHLHHPKYMGHQVPPPAPLAALTGLLTGFLNNGMAVYEMGMVSNPIERILMEWVAKRCGYGSKSSGLITSGGTLANLTALLAARAYTTNVWEEGATNRLAVMVSDEAHYCIDRAARIMGFGTEGVIKLPTDAHFRMKTELLEEYYTKARADGLTVIAVVGSAGSTSTGAYENLEDIANFCEKHKIWFHVDGAHGGAVIFSEKYKPLVKGLNRADSMILDFHKMLLTPALATALVFKRGGDAFKTFQQKAQYLWANHETLDWFNSGKRTFECTKSMICLKIYALLKAYGEPIFTENVETLYDLGKTFAILVKRRSNFELGVEPESNIVCFRYVEKGKNDAELNALNNEKRAKLLRAGNFYIVQTTLKGKVFLRVSLMNPLTSEKDLVALLDEIEGLIHKTE
jgi:L-2,4-diaminobutyrate decarboxylase